MMSTQSDCGISIKIFFNSRLQTGCIIYFIVKKRYLKVEFRNSITLERWYFWVSRGQGEWFKLKDAEANLYPFHVKNSFLLVASPKNCFWRGINFNGVCNFVCLCVCVCVCVCVYVCVCVLVNCKIEFLCNKIQYHWRFCSFNRLLPVIIESLKTE